MSFVELMGHDYSTVGGFCVANPLTGLPLELSGNRLRIAVAGQVVIDQSVDEAERVWSNALEQHFAKRVA